MAAALVPPTKNSIRPTKNAHPTYEICPSNLRKMPIHCMFLIFKNKWSLSPVLKDYVGNPVP